MVAGIPGDDLCAQTGISRSQLSRMERGYVRPSEDAIRRLEQALNHLIEVKRRQEEVAAELARKPSKGAKAHKRCAPALGGAIP